MPRILYKYLTIDGAEGPARWKEDHEIMVLGRLRQGIRRRASLIVSQQTLKKGALRCSLRFF